HQAFLFFRFPDGEVGKDRARAWIKDLQPHIATAEEVATFNRVFRLVRKRLRKLESTVLHSTWVNVGFSADGLQRLIQQDEFEAFKKVRSEFTVDSGQRASDLDEQPPPGMGGSAENEPSAIVIIGADSEPELWAAIKLQRRLAANL